VIIMPMPVPSGGGGSSYHKYIWPKPEEIAHIPDGVYFAYITRIPGDWLWDCSIYRKNGQSYNFVTVKFALFRWLAERKGRRLARNYNSAPTGRLV
jgi:hypothetical protein